MALLCVLSMLVPALERAEAPHRAVIETEHHPGSCPTPHDHTVCVQVAANQSVVAPRNRPLRSVVSQITGSYQATEPAPQARPLRQAPARAPPLV